MNDHQSKVLALLAVADIIEDTARESMPMGAPSGIVYMALNGVGLTLDSYQTVLQAMQNTGRITVENDLIRVPQK